MFYHFYSGHQPSPGNDFWVASTAVATFLAVLVALFNERFWSWWKRPIINATFDQRSERCVRLATDVTKPQLSIVRKYFRLHVLNKGRTTVKGLKAKIEIYDMNDKPVDFFEPSLLRWIVGSAVTDLAPNEEEYLNLCSQTLTQDVSKRFRVEIFDTQTLRGIEWDRDLDQYKMRIAFHADNLVIPVMKSFIFKPGSEKDYGTLTSE
ncbi:MAG: hypothetical protein WC641_06920 [Patescibacteria group bacterium]